MSKIKDYLLGFFKRVEETDCSAVYEETVDGNAFTYNIYKFSSEFHMKESDTITATVTAADGQMLKVSEPIGKSMVIDAVSIFRCKEAFGLTECVGAVFGKTE